LEVRDLEGDRFGPVSLAVRAGEIVGLAGAEGNGQQRLLRTVAGLEPATDGAVLIDGADIDRRSPGHALRGGVMFVSGERLRESLFPVLGVRANSSIQVLDRFSSLGWVQRRHEADAVEAAAADLRVRAASVEQPVRFLSGGNQQKVVLTRPFLRDVRVLVTEEPTQGVDVGSRFEIYEAMRSKAATGIGIIVQSSDPIELAGLCDRVVVMSRGRIVDELAADDLDEARIVDAVVRAQAPRAQSGSASPVETVGSIDAIGGVQLAAGGLAGPPSVRGQRQGGQPWMPVLVLLGVAVAIGAYTATRSNAFLTEYNLKSLLLLTVPLALASMGQLNALLVGQFDISIGAVMGLTVVCASFVLTNRAWWLLALGTLAVLGIALAVGVFNAGLIRLLSVPSIIATIATLSVLQGVALMLRPTPGGLIDTGFLDLLTAGVGFVPYSFIAVALGAVGLDVWLHRSRDGLVTRAVGFDETAAERAGAMPGIRHLRAFVAAALFGALGGLALAALVGIGDARLGGGYALASIAAAVLGGAALSGGRGSFLGALIGAIFFSLILNVLPFLGWGSAWGDIGRGAITLAALVVFQRGHLLRGGTRRVRLGR
jgi:ribose transport system ATP-binding protein